jgi:peptidoglycan hydrolase-like protein with peptidoglycan-binding domain
LQTLLARAGQSVAATGNFDEATAEAVIGFKLKAGLHQQYRNADGTFAVNEYVDEATARAIVEAATKATPAAGTGAPADTQTPTGAAVQATQPTATDGTPAVPALSGAGAEQGN